MAPCSVKNCTNNYRKSANEGKQLSFLRIPAGPIGESWKSRCQITVCTPESRVCSDHFRPDQFRTSNRLMKNELPCLKLPIETVTDDLYKKLKSEIQSLQDKVTQLQTKLKRKETQLASQTRTVTRLKKRLLREVHQTSIATQKNLKISKEFELLSGCFSKSQINMLVKKTSKAYWTEDDISRAIVLKAKSSSAYELLRSAWNFPLPGISTLRRWVSKINFKPGLIQPILSLLKAQFQDANLFKRQCVLCSDEMNLDGMMCFDEKTERIVGPHSNFMVMYVRGLFDKWKQPIFYQYDYKFTRTSILNIVDSLRKIGLVVKSITSDMCPSNCALRKELDFSIEEPYFKCPETNRKIYIFYDLPHIIKRLRDNTLDYELTLADGTKFSVDDFFKILDADRNEFRVCHKLTRKHLTVTGRERMNVRMAMQLYSGSVARCLQHYFGFDKRLQRLAEFVHLINDFTDLMNSRHLDQNLFRATPEQLQILDKIDFEIKGLRVGKSNHLLPFQKGILFSTSSIRQLFHDVSIAPLNAEYLITCHFNQDIAENGFGVMRGMGHFHQNPNCLEAEYRLKLLMLGWTFKPSNNANTNGEVEPRPFVSSGLLKALTCEQSVNSLEFVILDDITQQKLEQIQPIIDDTMNDVTWTQYKQSQPFKQRMGTDAEEYVYGYIVAKLKQDYPDMQLHQNLEQRFPKSWVQLRPGMTIPSYDWFNTFRKFDEYFLAFHQKVDDEEKFHVNRAPAVCKILQSVIQDYFPEIPSDIIKVYVRVRTMVRIKAINNELKKLRFRRLNKNAQFRHLFIPDVEPFPSTSEAEINGNAQDPGSTAVQNSDQQLHQCLDAILNSGSDWELLDEALDQLSMI